MNQVYDVMEYGARGDGKVLETEALQRAIDACFASGGGRVEIGSGVFRTGTLELKSNVELHLSTGSRIVGSENLDDYRPLVTEGFLGESAPERSRHALIMAVNAENIAITGRGTVHGSGHAFYDCQAPEGKFSKPDTPRPRIGMFFRCRNMLLQDTAYVDSPCWTLWLMQCQSVKIHRISISGDRRMRNVDGIDIDSCQNVTVSDCHINTEDDCIVLRSMRNLYKSPAICENVVVSNCVLESGCQAVRVGCPGDGIIRNCALSNLVINSDLNGIVFDNPKRYLSAGCCGGAHLSNIRFSNVVMKCRLAPIRIFIEEGIALEKLCDLSFSDFDINSGQACIVQGSRETAIENIRFSNMRIATHGDDAIILRRCKGVHLSNVELSNIIRPAGDSG